MRVCLAGFAVSATLSAAGAILETVSDRLHEMLVWLLGSLAQTTGPQLAVAAPLLTLGACGLLILARDLNVVVLGDEQAQYLGLNVAQRRLLTDTCHRQGLPS